MSAFNKESWKRFSGESGSMFVPVRMPANFSERPLSQATLADMQASGAMKELLQNYGARLNINELPPLNGNASVSPEVHNTLETIQLQID
jgi:hypothetical protein